MTGYAELVRNFVDAFELTFRDDWAHTRHCLQDEWFDIFIPGDSFLEPGVPDESANWWNRGALLAAYRKLKAATADRCEGEPMTTVPVPESCLLLILGRLLIPNADPIPARFTADARNAIASAWETLTPDTRERITTFVTQTVATYRMCASTPHGDPAYCDRLMREASEWEAWLADVTEATT